METIYKSSYFEVSNDPSKQMFYFSYSEDTFNMQSAEYIESLRDFIKLIYQHTPKFILGDMVDFQFIITPDIQQWIDENLFKVYEEIGFKKIALLLSKEYVPKLSIQQTMEEDSTDSFKTRYFDNSEEALTWLLAS
ncbi:MAG TPA: hypothetical protein DCS93_39255 [Microscillaceae bacterium]|nr:hypothetical protein [Microscillaceae bacterium]